MWARLNYLFEKPVYKIVVVSMLMFACDSSMPVQDNPEFTPFILSVDELKNWTSTGSTADDRNIATIPLATRFTEGATQLNPDLGNDAKLIYAPDGMNNLGNYLEEQSKFNLFNFTHWAYIDKLIWFGGTADETVQIPAAPWVNAAHKNGVKVIGNVFFAPTAFGGNTATVSNFLQKDDQGKFVAAQKLKAIVEYYQFDGWFINMETDTNATNGQLMLDFVKELKSILPEDKEVIWYDAMLPEGDVKWQNELNNNNIKFLQDNSMIVSDGMFINFFWSGSSKPFNSKSTATNNGRSEFDVFTGIDLWPGRNQQVFELGGNEWMASLHEADRPITSVAFFAANLLFDHDNYSTFKTNEDEVGDFYSAERHLFGGQDRNPATEDAGGFKGIANWIPASSVITSLPFITNFNTGHGKIFATEGAQSARSWHDMGKQDILPTWQFAREGNSDLVTDFDFTTAYNGGTSLKVTGDLTDSGETTFKLYKTSLRISAQTKIAITYKTDQVNDEHMKLVVAFSDNPADLITLAIAPNPDNNWHRKTLDLGPYNGKELAIIGLQFSTTTTINNYQVNIGQLAITDDS
ncbi:hypothetical protein QQ020_00970 [Fulvivirgaceae bacterium BMA12]|uniref:Cytosolic endo-beta-N-acetylglucosaminidase TIM barrel domain-containing protein n=1 Tax=Agaribacillus aureus TaxID=3051825 RepID=A0ABT8L0J4_9BACT|nr:hypothetical protein [Fulvivirgaceae bacterium BMA12]